MPPKHYYFDAKKEKYIARATIDGKTHHIGTFENEQLAESGVANFLNQYYTDMPPKRKIVRIPANYQYTLQDAIDFINSTQFAQGTKDNYVRCLTVIATHIMEDVENYRTMTTEQLADIHAPVDLYELFKNYDLTKNLIEKEIKTKDGKDYAVDSLKAYFQAIGILLTPKPIYETTPDGTRERIKYPANDPKHMLLDTETVKKYNDIIQDYNKMSNEARKENKPKGIAVENPEITYNTIHMALEKFLTEQPFDNTPEGRKNLRAVAIVAFYTFHLPRRLEDAWLLQYYTELPDFEKIKKDQVVPKELEGKNILYIPKEGDAYFIFDKFKTRTRTVKHKKKTVLLTYVKKINSRLLDLLKDYVKMFKIKDMANLTAREKRNNLECYVFHKESSINQEKYSKSSGFGEKLQSSSKLIFGNEMSANDFRHLWSNWLVNHFNEFNDAQQDIFAEDVGDTAKNLPTNLRYRFQNQKNVGKSKTEIVGEVLQREADDQPVEGGGAVEPEISVQNIIQQENANEVNQPPVVSNTTDIVELINQWRRSNELFAEILLRIVKKN